MNARLVSLAGIALLAACSTEPPAQQYELKGQILGIEPTRNEVLIRHDAIKGFMPAMTMPFTVKETALLSGKQPGDLVTATLVVTETTAHLSSLSRTGHAPLDASAVPKTPHILMAGEPVPDAALVDQRAAPRRFSSFRGHRVALTFIYTRCPLPDFCPLMDRHFVALQKVVQATPALRDVRLVSVTLDPEFDTPAVLSRHAARLEADPAIWSFLTGTLEDVATFSRPLGIYTEKDLGSGANLTHNLRTAIIDADGRLVTVHSGNDWKPADLVAELTAIPAPAN